jgi:Holliday junction resolvase RusA-like endonuclease
MNCPLALRALRQGVNEAIRYWKAKREALLTGLVRPTKRPDADNILKNVDGLNGVAWIDDAQLVSATVEKWWAPTASVTVRLEPA